MEENKFKDSDCGGSSSSSGNSGTGEQQQCPCGPSTTTQTDNGGSRVRNAGVVNSPAASTSSSGTSSRVAMVASRPSSGITVVIHPTTGGQFELQVDRADTIEQLKKTISKRFRVAKERICLLHRDKDLRDGNLLENSIQDGSKITLLPMVETGLLAQRPEQSVLQALESLSDSQVNDFLSGRAPLNLTMRLGDHLMFIQLQLSTVGGQALSTSSSSTTGSAHQSTSTHRRSSASHRHHHHHHHHHHSGSSRPSTSGSTYGATPVTSTRPDPTTSTRTAVPPSATARPDPTSARPSASLPDGVACSGCSASATTSSTHPAPGRSSSSSSSSMTAAVGSSSSTPAVVGVPSSAALIPAVAAAAAAASASTGGAAGQPMDVTHLLDTRTLAEASRNLSQTLRHLSSKALNVRGAEVKECSHNCSSARRQGAIIESMHHHGRGVYSGTFSGTLNPALQDRHGHPKRDISTIVHILNDLLGATPQYRRHGARHSLEITGGSSNGQPSGASSSKTVASIAPSKSSEEFDQENQATRGKMEQLQLMMEERRARRRARREARSAPYPSVTTTSPISPNTPAARSVSGDVSLCSDTVVDHLSTSSVVHRPSVTISEPTDSASGIVTNPAPVMAVSTTTSEGAAEVKTAADGPTTETVPMDCAESAESAESTMDTSGATATNEYLKLNPETVVV